MKDFHVSYLTKGNFISKTVLSLSLYTAIVPSCNSIIFLVMAKPKPEPPILLFLDFSTL